MDETGNNVIDDGPEKSFWISRFFSKLARYTALLRRGWWVMAVTMLLGALAAYAASLRSDAPYVSRARMILSSQLYIPGVTQMDGGYGYNWRYLDTFFGTQITLMQSEQVESRVLARIEKDHPRLTGGSVSVDVSQEEETSIFELKAVGDQEELTQVYLNILMEEYLDLRASMQGTNASVTLDAITSEINRLEQELNEGDNRILEFRTKNNLVFLEEIGVSSGRELARIKSHRTDLETKRELGNVLKEYGITEDLETFRSDIEGSMDGNGDSRYWSYYGILSKKKSELATLTAQLEDWAQFMKPLHPKMQALERELAIVRNDIKLFGDMEKGEMANREQALKLQIETLENIYNRIESDSLAASRKKAEYDRLKSQQDRAQSLYDNLLNTVQSVDVGSNLAQEQINILDRASAPVMELPNFGKQVATGAMVGFVLGAFLLLAGDRFNDRFHSMAELQEHFQEDVLCQIPLETAPKDSPLASVAHKIKEGSFLEAFRSLFSIIRFMPGEGKKLKTILVTSAVPGEGKSTLSSRLAITVANTGAKVLLLETDLRRGNMRSHFGIEKKEGLSEVLSGSNPWRDCIAPTQIPNLDLLSRGRQTSQPGELLMGEEIGRLIREAEQEYDYVLLDSAPVLATNDPANLASVVDAILFVVRADFTRARMIYSSLERLEKVRGRLLGLVFNSVDTSQKSYYLDYYNYGEYYSQKPDTN